ncbi:MULTISPECIES: endonuclease/exonuclease/phosphatase family protein [unclassified Mycobacterium]|uniref:endonuclease/exonuclease/phosphatase family protein n=1 Tax=unclassified Mycobacterium TaxID=2642494 RepID=UPI0009EDAF50|nr:MULTISPECIES: endonuclease/exonuclease/phosphatase family protein [unclassified Mycobacterium]
MPQTAIGLVALVVAGCAFASRYLSITCHATLITAALSPYLMLCAPVSAALLLWGRRWTLAIVAVGLAMAMLAVQLPLYRGSNAAGPASLGLRVISANLRLGQADPGDVVRLAREQADVIAFQELTQDEADRLAGAGLDATFPYRWLEPRDGPGGAGVWSRFAIDAPERIGGYTFAFLTARIRVAGVSVAPTVVVAHMAGPWPVPIDDWRRDMSRLPSTLSEVGEHAGAGSVIVAADMNSTTDMRPFRALLGHGYSDAAEQSGTGFKPTFPADSWLPPFIAIDHILTRNCAATSLRTLTIPGSDHRGLLVTIAIPKSSARP